ncbi:MAG: lysophospholipid acyltransferase family protein [Pseudomonadales bacterium]
MRRRLITIPTVLLLTIMATLLLPALLLIGLLMTALPRYRGTIPTLLFVLGYLWCETVGITRSFYIWLRYRDPSRFIAANYRLQYWWTGALKHIAECVFRLRFEVHGEDALRGAPALVLPRHASIADTVIPMVFYAMPRQVRLRYVLKKELLLDPCLDIVGNRLPNYFVDRDGQDSAKAREGVGQLVAQLKIDEGVLIYPEGTRFSETKRAALRARYAEVPEMLAQLDRWKVLLPPRLGGTLALLNGNPGRDLLFCAHSGFEGSSHFSNLINGSWMRAHINITFWRVPFSEIPKDVPGQVEFLFRQWDRMHDEVTSSRQQTPEAQRPADSQAARSSRTDA